MGTSSVSRWLASTKNIVGSVLGIATLGAHVAVGLGPLWPVVVVAMYAVGALVAPRDRVDLRPGPLHGDGGVASAADLAAQLAVLRRSMTAENRRLPDEATSRLARILDALDQVIARWTDLTEAADQAHTVEQMILDYLPTSIQRFLNLPRSFAIASRVEGKKTAEDELIEQLDILETESDRIRTALYAKDLAALEDQSRFLREKFGRSELDL
ncbi:MULTISPECIES: hypothetical protein [unclassified Cryobacterium]|uniref:hypothetical protein n=1 Tax=unclassified Cryobacterium TaxID=2649013 RepID=UPI002AB59F2F|nr:MULTISPECIES: hypothetical protein [unclassified Cryobacterium]MDY7527745.1 hypothetical protein [Cryobacterium sp. 10C2]MDY7556482.1 hypothetical protein [Cryobacterium sp. 10C3]MEB0001476.1 hypothetical protein [Cryobacterium sp. RTC2.1]MEB0200226.1 hypothetical protein [Cryobacterium sp. 5I3]MEB0285128.1 hypothetical protein [Cryobacterium sp. 10S3]